MPTPIAFSTSRSAPSIELGTDNVDPDTEGSRFGPRASTSLVAELCPEQVAPLAEPLPTGHVEAGCVYHKLFTGSGDTLLHDRVDIPDGHLDGFYAFHFIGRSWTDLYAGDLQTGDVVVEGRLEHLLALFRSWKKSGLIKILEYVSLPYSTRVSAAVLKDSLSSLDWPRSDYYVFRRLRRIRRAPRHVDHIEAAAIEPDLAAGNSGEHASPHHWFRVLSDSERFHIIREWQASMGSKAFTFGVCAVCARRYQDADILKVSPHDVAFELLRNDYITRDALPTTYNLEAYDHAILHPKGLTDRDQKGTVLMCKDCEGDLLLRKQLPKYALANFLYYGREELPPDVGNAFKNATDMDRMLVARARSSRICYRYSSLRGHEGTGSDRNPDTSQSCIKGNVMVVPQDAAALNSVLPPSLEEIGDTVSVVFVGKTKPTRQTIEKLSPVLVRKSRVKCMIDFLVSQNPHYAPDDSFGGFEQSRLDVLFGPGTSDVDVGVPCSVEIGHLEESEATTTATSDYTSRAHLTLTPGDEGLLMENVGYTDGDTSRSSYTQMKLAALAHCRSGKKFILSQSGNQPVPDFQNPDLLTWLFPHLDPWGIGGFFHVHRQRPLTMKEQLKYLLSVDDSPFATDSSFAFVYYNILQKKKILDSVRFKVKTSQQERIARMLNCIDPDVLNSLLVKLSANDKYQPTNEAEKAILRTLSAVGLSTSDVEGTEGYMLHLRNQIRSLIYHKGTPSLFVTLNPSDEDNPIVRLLTGEHIDIDSLSHGEELTQFQRRVMVAKDPAACAIFFDKMIKAFISVILGYGKEEGGIFGKCTAYFGTVEAQGKGTLHCHMLIWLDGVPLPQELRDEMAASDDYRDSVFRWMESIIKQEYVGMTAPAIEPDGHPFERPPRAEQVNERHPGIAPCPAVDALAESVFAGEFKRRVNSLVSEYNWHTHTATCWKYLRPGDAKIDANCRMRINGSTQAQTSIDPETGSILLRRLHPRIAAYNDVVTFLMRCNTDVKFIGSGPGAKALVYYVTDYVTKPPLSAHAGVAAIAYAIKRMGDTSEDRGHCKSSTAVTMTVNAMMARKEISHQQSMSYFVGSGDHYASESFKTLYWTLFDAYVSKWEGSENMLAHAVDNGADTVVVDGPFAAPNVDTAEVEDAVMEEVGIDVVDTDAMDVAEDVAHSSGTSGEGPGEATTEHPTAECEDTENVTLLLGDGGVSVQSQRMDYMMRSSDVEFDSMSLYEFVGLTEKVTIKRDNARVEKRTSNRGRPANARGTFMPNHPQYSTHVLRKRVKWIIPVILGAVIPRPDINDELKERWARAMLILFVPWRTPSGIRLSGESWTAAFDRVQPTLSEDTNRFIHHMNVLSECKDARDDDREAQRITRALIERGGDHDVGAVPVAVDEFVHDVHDGFDMFDLDPALQTGKAGMVDSIFDSELDSITRRFLDLSYGPQVPGGMSETIACKETGVLPVGEDAAVIKRHNDLMVRIRRRRKLEVSSANESTRPAKRRRMDVATLPSMTVDNVPDQIQSISEAEGEPAPRLMSDVRVGSVLEAIETVVKDQHLNEEQERAFRIVGEHLDHGVEQLQMYIAGVGGTGKSHVVWAIQKLFKMLGRENELLIAAPTGSAAQLIGGFTIHALLNMSPNRKGLPKDATTMRKTWTGVRYYIVDEVSMLGALLMSSMCAHMRAAKGDEFTLSDQPFGGVNIIFTGDFGQLPPVMAKSLYNKDLVKLMPGYVTASNKGISELNGVALWRAICTVVVLHKNLRQKDDQPYVELLSRVRAGQTYIDFERRGPDSDIAALRTRDMHKIGISDPAALVKFKYAPVIVGLKTVRDAINARRIRHHSLELGEQVHLYYSQDFISKKPVEGAQRLRLWSLPAGQCKDISGRLPLFRGMKVMVRENVAFVHKAVNGGEGVVDSVRYREDEHGRRIAVVVYVRIEGAGKVCEDLDEDIVPIIPQRMPFKDERGYTGSLTVSREQVPLVPGYAYTDYKSQGRSLKRAIVDIQSAQSSQGIYVMLSRVSNLDGLLILRPFQASKFPKDISGDYKAELARIARLDIETAARYDRSRL